MNNNYIKVSIKGRNVNNYLKWLIKQKLEINKINIINHKELEVLVHYKDYKKLTKYSKTYKIKVIISSGIILP
ncbi:MAG: sporulation protein YqfD [Bacilli bacterium]|nr:sporulation protein YqfD [Bacilli bacterium]